MIRRLVISEKDKEQLSTASWDPASQQDDLFDYSKVVIPKPWGYEYLLARTSDVAVWALHIAAGKGTSFHCHPNKKTSIMVLSGEAECSTLKDNYRIGVGEGLLLEKGVFHSTRAVSPEGIIVLETETPTNKRDLVRLSDSYGRVGKGYEGSACYTDLDGTVHCHFHGDEELSPKVLGACHVSLIQYQEPISFSKAFLFHGIVAVLAGGTSGTAVFQVGDVFSTKQMNEIQRNSTNIKGTFLIITKT